MDKQNTFFLMPDKKVDSVKVVKHPGWLGETTTTYYMENMTYSHSSMKGSMILLGLILLFWIAIAVLVFKLFRKVNKLLNKHL